MASGVDQLSDRRREIRDRLREALRDPDFYRLCLDGISACRPTTSLEAALLALPYRYRRALILCYGPAGEDMTREHIGSLLGIAERTVKYYCKRGIEAMIEQI